MKHGIIDADVVRTKCLEIVDNNGKVRAWLRLDPVNSAPFLYLMDENELERIGLLLDDKGCPAIRVSNAAGTGMLAMRVTDNCSFGLKLARPNGTDALHVDLHDDGETSVVLFDGKGNVIFSLGASGTTEGKKEN